MNKPLKWTNRASEVTSCILQLGGGPPWGGGSFYVVGKGGGGGGGGGGDGGQNIMAIIK